MGLSDLSECMHVHKCAWYLQKSKEGIRSPETETPDGCEPPGSLEANPASSLRAISALNHKAMFFVCLFVF